MSVLITSGQLELPLKRLPDNTREFVLRNATLSDGTRIPRLATRGGKIVLQNSRLVIRADSVEKP